jgi:hypothetical protein
MWVVNPTSSARSAKWLVNRIAEMPVEPGASGESAGKAAGIVNGA